MSERFDNWAAAQDVAHQVHGFTNLRAHAENGPFVVTRGDGVYVVDDKGRRYLDATAGMYCTALGFSERALAEAAYKQMLELPTYHNLLSTTSPPAIALCEKLAEITPAGLDKVFLVNSGSEANDTAVKLVWYLNNALGRPEKKKIISRRGSYHGATVAAASLTGVDPMHMGFDVPLPGFLRVNGPNRYRDMAAGETDEAYADRLIAELEALIAAEGAETIAAMVVDPIASSSGFQISPESYFDKLQAVLRRHDILFVVDEVIAGFGRTGNMFACETFALRPDIMTLAKGIISAYLPLAAVVVSDAVFEAMVRQSDSVGWFFQAFTTAGHPTTSAVALRNIELIEERDVIGHVRAVAPHFQRRLKAMEEHALVGNTRGVGLAGAMELVPDKAARGAFAPEEKARIGKTMRERAPAHGLISRGFGEVQSACPPLIISAAEIDALFDLYRRCFDDVARVLRADGILAA